MNYFKIIVAYDGTNYHGWQIQPHNITICEQLQKSFKHAFDMEVIITGASRTDSGVHADGQTARIRTELSINPATIINAWNNVLPSDIVIKNLESVELDEFHPIKDVKQKTYHYHLFLERPNPFFARYGWFWHLISTVDMKKFEKALKLFEGTHNFRSFVKLYEEKDTVRTIDKISIEHIKEWNALRVVIKGKSFLHFQIRRMIGAALDNSRKKEHSLDKIQHMLDYPQAQQSYVKAEGNGLVLNKIVYNE